jgi:hypothetical protein
MEAGMGYYFPPFPEPGTTPQGLQWVLTTMFIVVIAGFIGRALIGWQRTGSPVGLLLLIGATIASLNEGLVDVAGLCWYPVNGQWVGYNTIHSVPLWCVLAYTAYHGGGAYIVYEKARAGMSRRTLWIALGIMWASEIVFEIAVINLGGYQYFGEQPLSIAGWPIYWLAVNFPGFFVTVAVLVRMPHLLRGWRVVLTMFLPIVTYPLGFGSGLPVFSALHTRNPSWVLLNGATALTFAIGITVIALAISVIAEAGPLGPQNRGVLDADERRGQLVGRENLDPLAR